MQPKTDGWSSHMFEIHLHGVVAFGSSEFEAFCNWKKAAQYHSGHRTQVPPDGRAVSFPPDRCPRCASATWPGMACSSCPAFFPFFDAGGWATPQPGRAQMPPLTMKQCARPNGFTAPNGQHAAVPAAQCAPTVRDCRQGQAHEQTRPRAHP